MLHNIDNFNTQYKSVSTMEVRGNYYQVHALFSESDSSCERITNYRSGPIAENSTGTLLIKIDQPYDIASQTDGYSIFHKIKSKLYHYQTFAMGGLNWGDIEPALFKIASELTGLDVIAIPCIEPDRTRILDHPVTPVNDLYDASLILESFLEIQAYGDGTIPNTGFPARFLCEPDSFLSFESGSCDYQIDVRISRADSTHWNHTLLDDSDENRDGYIIYVQVTDNDDFEPLAGAIMGAVGTTLTLLDYKLFDWREDDDILDIVLDKTANYLHETFGPKEAISLPLVTDSHAGDMEAQTAA